MFFQKTEINFIDTYTMIISFIGNILIWTLTLKINKSSFKSVLLSSTFTFKKSILCKNFTVDFDVLIQFLRYREPRDKICSSILHTVGNTPLVKLNRIPVQEGLKCEMCKFIAPIKIFSSIKEPIKYGAIKWLLIFANSREKDFHITLYKLYWPPYTCFLHRSQW